MNYVDQFITALTRLDRRKFHLYLGSILLAIAGLSGGIVYWLYSSRAQQIISLTQLQEISSKVDVAIRNHEKISAEEERIQALLEEHKGFSIKTYFEQFCREHSVTPESGWDTESRSIEGNDTFDEIILPAQFKNQTTQGLVSLLSSLNNNEIVYIKELEIKNDGNQTMSFDLTIATKKRKQFWED